MNGHTIGFFFSFEDAMRGLEIARRIVKDRVSYVTNEFYGAWAVVIRDFR